MVSFTCVMNMEKNFLYRWIFLFSLLAYVHCDCVWYGQCGSAPDNPDHKLNCPYSGPPKSFKTDEALKLFQKNCPLLYKENTKTCCSDSQIQTLDSQIGVPRQLLQRCPSCFHNFMNIWCYLTCGTEQNEWMTIDQTINNTGKVAIEAVTFYLTHEFANGMFSSCKNVHSPSTNSPALSLLCGTTAAQCTVQKWLDYMGSTTTPQVPFEIHFDITDDDVPVKNKTLHPLNATVVPCDKPVTSESSPCSCQDCVASCSPQPPIPPPAKPCEVAHIDCYTFGFGLLFCVFLVCFGFYVICYSIMVQNSFRLKQSEDLSTPGCCPTLGGDASERREKKRQNLERIKAEDLGRCETIGARMDVFLSNIFRRWGFMCASRPFIVITVVLVLSVILCAGNARFTVTTDPVLLWSAPESRARIEKEYYDSHFVPFYRTEQLIITRPRDKEYIGHINKNMDNVTYSSVFELSFLHQMLDLQNAVQNLEAVYDSKPVRLEDICFAPLSPDNNNCTIESILNYFQNSHENLDKYVLDISAQFNRTDYIVHFDYCTQDPTSVSDTSELHLPCVGTYGGPIFPWVALGGFKDKKYNTSQALVITFVVNNHDDKEKNKPAEAWESVFIEFIKNYTKNNPGVSIAFSAERSIEDEISRESDSDIATIVISYLIMFGYITLTLGRYVKVERIFVDAKISLGLSGVLLVLLSVGSSLGFYSYCGIASTLIIIEVVPFLVLAVGVDNIFIVVQNFQRQTLQEGESAEELVARVIGKVGPSMFLTSFSESVAFFLGALTSMPAVKVFSLYAAMAVLLNFLMQITIFVSLLCLDAKRQEANRLDALCCVRSSAPKNTRSAEGGILYRLVKKYYSRFLLAQWMRPIVMISFVGWFCASAAMVSRISIGLDQSLSMPKDSYMLDYFGNLSAFLSVGAPVYFVARNGSNFSSFDIQNEFCSVNGCPQVSLVQQIDNAASIASHTRIAQPVSSWLDDYLAWTTSPGCCRYHNDTNDFCPSESSDPDCVACQLKHLEKGRPVGKEFDKYLPWYLKDNPGIKCAKGGHAAYGNAVQLYNNSQQETSAAATYYMTYHSILKTSKDYIDALKEARQIADNISKTFNFTIDGNNHHVFPYSVFYVYYEQYLTIVHDSAMNILICLLAIFVITFLLLGLDFYSATMVVVTIVMIIVDMMGMMYLWDIDLNAISLVNLIMAIGISVEFTAHIVRAFAISILPTRKQRANEALVQMGSSVLSGITLTKLGGIIVLAFSKSQLFQVFYFRMYLCMVAFGATHGLIFLPVMLSYFGPPVNKAKYFSDKIQEMTIQESLSTDARRILQGTTPTYQTFPSDADANLKVKAKS